VQAGELGLSGGVAAIEDDEPDAVKRGVQEGGELLIAERGGTPLGGLEGERLLAAMT